MAFDQSTQNIAFIGTIIGGVIAAVSSILTALVTHFFTKARDRRQSEIDQANQRKALLGTKLDEMVSCLTGHIRVLENLSLLPIPLAATLVAGSPMPWKFDEEALDGRSFVAAQTIGALYFPEFVEEISNVGKCENEFRALIRDVINSLHQAPREWLKNSTERYVVESNDLLSRYKNALADLLFKARTKVQREYL
jgi:hypothetical protein